MNSIQDAGLEDSRFPNVRKEVQKIASQKAGPLLDRAEAVELETDPRWAIVRVSVGNLRFQPRHHAELGTQVLLGTVLKVLREHGSWFYVQSPDQYLGWIEGSTVVVGDSELAQRWLAGERLIVTELQDRLMDKPDKLSFPVSDVVAGCLLHDAGHAEGWNRLRLPDGRIGYMRQGQVVNFERWKKTIKASPENLERVARSLMGLPYLWGGTSTKSVDCSGFTKTVYLLNGIQLNRDATHQSLQGEEVMPGADFQNLQKGDLLFFGKKAAAKRGEEITHVAMYLDQRVYIHSSGMVRLNSLDPQSPLFDEERLKTFIRARRILAM